MRILHLGDRLSTRGGAHLHLQAIIDRQSVEHEVHLGVGLDDGTAAPPCPTTLLPGLESRTRREVELDRLCDSIRPDLIHMHNLVNPAALEWAACHDAILTVQDHRFFCPGKGKWTASGEPCREAMSRELCAHCFEDPGYRREIVELTEERLEWLDRLTLVVLSRYMRDELAAVGIDRERISVVSPFVHGLDLNAVADGPPCILFVGRLVESKGVEDAIAAWKISQVGLPLVMAGTGPLRSQLQGAEVGILGWVGRGALSALYRRSVAVVMPSRWQEPFGIVGLEALTMGAPVVAWDSGGVGEWHPGPGLVAWGDQEGLGRELARAAFRKARPPAGFEPERAMAALERVYRSRL